MRNLKLMLKAFVGVAAFSSVLACEEGEPPRARHAVVAAPASTQPEVKPEVKPLAKLDVKPAEILVTPTVTSKRELVPPAIDDAERADLDDPVAGARAALTAGELDRALRFARLAVQKSPKRSAAWNTLGRVQLARGERKDARGSFERAVELNPSSSYAQNNLGLTLIYEGQYDDAIDALEEATDADDHVEAYMWNNLGMAYEHQDRLVEARDAYRKAAEMKSPRASENLARLEGVKTIRTARLDETPAQPVDLPAVDH